MRCIFLFCGLISLIGTYSNAAALLRVTNMPNCSSDGERPASWEHSFLELESPDGTVRTAIPLGPSWVHNPEDVLACTKSRIKNGTDAVGPFQSHIYWWVAALSRVRMVTELMVYDDGRTVRFFQRFPSGVRNISMGDPDGVATAFPSFKLQTNGTPLGFAHFAGYMAGNAPQYGIWSSEAYPTQLQGGVAQSGVIVLFDAHRHVSIVLSPSSEFMVASLATRRGVNSNDTYCDFGVIGAIDELPTGFSASWIVVAAPHGPADAVREWGRVQRELHGRQSEEETHTKDITTTRLGYATDNGAFYYYYTGPKPNSTYDTVLRDVKDYATAERIPYGYIELDSWWYYRQDGSDTSGVPLSGVSNWTAMPNIFPDRGLPGAFNLTQWPVMAHNRYWASNNVYASNPQLPNTPTQYTGKHFHFAWGIGGGLPDDDAFWEYFFSINSDWGLTVYLQDWLSMTTASMPQLVQNATFGSLWLKRMGRGAAQHNLTIQYCMSYPRHVLQALDIPVVTTARASNDYLPQTSIFDYNQWAIGESSLWVAAIGIVPSKDSFWTMTTPQYAPHYDPIFDTRETRCRLESVVASMSNGPVLVSDRVGFSNKSLILKSCDEDGRLLRPDTAAAPIDAYFVAKSFAARGMLTGRVHATWSIVGGFPHVYLLSVNLEEAWNLTAADLPARVTQPLFRGDVSQWLAYEANSTSVLGVLSPTTPLVLHRSDEWSFEYVTMAPVPSGLAHLADAWVFIGEQDKHIAASVQRFPVVARDALGGWNITILGAVHERVRVSFADLSSYRIRRATCLLTAARMLLRWPTGTCSAVYPA